MPVVPPPLYALGAGVVQHFLAPDRGAGRRSGALRKVAAAGVGAASVGLLAATSARFRSNHTTFEPFDPSKASTLVTDGPNAFTRNPMYVGMAGLLTAHAIARGGLLTLVPVAGFVAVIDRVQIAAEEQALTTLFGDEYAAYRARVPRWLGPPG
ncbi:methyltransferase family protein [Nocardioides speluncae]|uniref:methyltransferase family protein n=1 Tax=Nocardioides speluncae TaxID=2670337 RepID=UPI000D69A744|nr:isoprenylcysteine carboxylmethyltransferase family protein [Nocardioides speluncae]